MSNPTANPPNPPPDPDRASARVGRPQASTGPDDLAVRVPDPDRAQPCARRLARDAVAVLRTFVLATVAVPIVIYGLMPQLHKIRARIATRSSAR